MRPYTIPAGLWTASAFGLVLLLVGDKAWDAVGLVCLATPIVAMARAVRRGKTQ